MTKEQYLEIFGSVTDENLKKMLETSFEAVQKSVAEERKQLESQLSGESKKKSELENTLKEMQIQIENLSKEKNATSQEKLTIQEQLDLMRKSQKELVEKLEASERAKALSELTATRSQRVAELTNKLELTPGMTKHLINPLVSEDDFNAMLTEFETSTLEVKAKMSAGTQPPTTPNTTPSSGNGINGIDPTKPVRIRTY